MAGHYVYSCVETDLLSQGMVIALDYFNLPPGNYNDRRQDGKDVAARAAHWGVRWVRYLCAPFSVPFLPFQTIRFQLTSEPKHNRPNTSLVMMYSAGTILLVSLRFLQGPILV